MARIADFDETHQKVTSADYGVLKERIDQGFTDIQLFLSRQIRQGISPEILIVTGNQSIVDSDFNDALAQARAAYKIDFLRLGILFQDLTEELEGITPAPNQLLVFMRGGGPGLEIFDSIALCKKVLSLKIPFFTALGHQANKHLLDQVSDLTMPTPTAFGVYLRDLALQIQEENQ